jgi:hypothetical protein
MREMVSKEVKIFLTFFFIFSFFSQWNDAWDAEAIFEVTRAIVEEKRFEVDTFVNMTPLNCYYKGHYYSQETIGQPLVTSFIHAFLLFLSNLSQIPTYENHQHVIYYADSFPIVYYPYPGLFIAISKLFLTILTSALPAALSVLLVYKISKYFTENKKHRILTVLAYGLGTSIFPYGISFYNLALATFLILLSFCILFKSSIVEKKRKIYFFLAGIISGFATLTYLLAGLISLFLLFYALIIGKKKSIIFLLGYLMAISILPLYDYSIYKIPSGFFGITHEKKREIYKNYLLWSFPLESKNFAYQIPLRLLIDPFRGLFIYYPILIFSLLGLFVMFKERKVEAILILALFISFLVLITIVNFFYDGYVLYAWWGYFSFGPRRFVLLMPFLTIPLLYAFKKFNQKIILLLLFISIFINILGLQVWEDGVNKETYIEKMRNWQSLGNPILDRYLPLFLKNGPRSRIFESLVIEKRPIIWDAPQSPNSNFLARPEIPLFVSSFGIITLNMPFLCMLPLALVTFLIWRKEIIKRIVLNCKTKAIIYAIVCLLLIITFVRIKNFVWGDGWYLEGDWDPNHEHWMSENATILYFSSKKINKTLTFESSSFFRPRNLILYINDKYVKSFLIENISNVAESQKVSQLITFEKGLNIIKFSSLEGCEVPSELKVDGGTDCKSFKIGKLRLE